MARLTRADILFPTVFLATRSQSPTVDDYQKLCRILKYVKRGPDYGVLFRKDAGICATVYTDASHGLHEDGKGQIGIIATLGSGYVGARSSKIKMITLSSTESEQLALCEATTYAKWMRKMLRDLGHEIKTPTKLFLDNDSDPKKVHAERYHDERRETDTHTDGTTAGGHADKRQGTQTSEREHEEDWNIEIDIA